MPIPNFVCADYNTKKERVILWHVGNYKYQIERKSGDKLLSRTNYLNTSYEQAKEIFDCVLTK